MSDLLTIHDGLYVVRVCAGVNGVTLVSGLGANPSLEAAEDLATTRALERLSLSATAPLGLAPAQGTQPDGAATKAPAMPTPQPQPDRLNAPISPREEVLPPPDSYPEPAHAPRLIAPLKSNGQSLQDSVPDRPAAALASPPLPKATPLASKPASPVSWRDAADESADELIDLDNEPVLSIDLSDIIAQTDVELQRLGWGVDQGREFLEKTYGKRSRHDLTDDELLEFLLYLETQSPPERP
ncbi:MAG: hypothetical protein WBA99_10035 [Nodosilinea sp.]